MSQLADIEKITIYYQEFHHKCVTWYITIMGFFIAGVITSPASTERMTNQLLATVLLVTSLFCGVFFFRCLAHYGARIKCLTGYLEGEEAKIPSNWRKEHKNVGWEVYGAGSNFFITILVGMQVVLLFLVVVRYFI